MSAKINGSFVTNRNSRRSAWTHNSPITRQGTEIQLSENVRHHAKRAASIVPRCCRAACRTATGSSSARDDLTAAMRDSSGTARTLRRRHLSRRGFDPRVDDIYRDAGYPRAAGDFRALAAAQSTAQRRTFLRGVIVA